MLVQAVVQKYGDAYCQSCGQMARCTTLTVKCEDRAALVSHVFCEECIDKGIGVEVKLPDLMIREGMARRRRLSRIGERKTAREVGGTLTPASGATRGDGDVLTKNWMIEEKVTANKNWRLGINQLKKTIAQAANHKRDWVIRLKLPEGHDLAILDWRVWRGWMLDRDTAD